ncbi:MAG: phage minor head protein, partial [Bacteroidota bacterium]
VVPEEAVNYLRRKSFWISGVENDRTLKAIQRRLAEAAQKGKTYQEFLDELSDLLDEAGLLYRAQTVFRTNLYTAYTIGQLEQVNQMRDRFPLWRYLAILDSATRPEHAALNDQVFRVGEGPLPPIDYNCRCTAQYLHTYEVDANRIEPSAVSPTFNSGRRFDSKSAFDTWLGNRQAEMDGGIRLYVEEQL